MIKEAYCSYEVAKLLEEKGFPQHKTRFAYKANGEFGWSDDIEPYEYSAPAHQMAMRWLRKEHKIHISVVVSPIYGKVKDEKGRNTCGLLYWHYMASGVWMNENYNSRQRAFVVSGKSNEEAVEAALKYTLENLI